MMCIKNAEFSDDFKNAKCTYANCTIKSYSKIHANWDFKKKMTGFFGITFYRCNFAFLKSAENSAFFYPSWWDL
jgi:hypothetical protein